MPLQYPSPYNPYVEPKKPVNLPKIILITLGAIVLILAVIFLIIPMLSNGKSGDNNLGNNNNTGEDLGDNTSSYDCSSDVYNCANFTTKAEAQLVFDYCEEQGAGDIHQLDADGNGKACERLN